MLIDLLLLQQQIIIGVLVSLRLTGLIIAMPTMYAVPRPIKAMIIIGISLLMLPWVQAKAYDPFSLSFLLCAALQLLIGLVFGLALQLAFGVFTTCGEMISMQLGLSFAILNDPSITDGSMPIISHFYLLSISLLFFILDGHLYVIKTLAASFEVLAIDLAWRQLDWLILARALQWLLKTGIQLAMPVVAVILVVNLSFGVIAKSVPQFNMFALGFGLVTLLGFIIILVTFKQLPMIFRASLEAMVNLFSS